MAEIIERLKKEKAKAETEWFEQGKIDGLEFAKNLDYEDLVYALKWETIKEMPSNIIGYNPTQDEYFGEYFSEIFEEYDHLGFEDTAYNNVMPNDLYIEWEAGWKEGVQEFWDEVKDKI